MGQVINDDCFNVFSQLVDNSIDAIITDPPYGFIKGDFDFNYKDWDSYMEFVRLLIEPFNRILKDNGSLFIWGHALNIAYWQVEFDKVFNLLNHFKWVKTDSRLNSADFTSLRKFAPVSEHALFYEKKGIHTLDNKTGLEVIYSNPDCFKSIKEYMRDEKRKLKESKGWNEAKFCEYIKELTGFSSVIQRHYFADSQYCFPTESNYKLLQTSGFFQREYESLRLEYESLRRYFNISESKLNDCLIHSQESQESRKWKHPTQKPLGVMDKIITAITKEGQTILDPFAGSGSTLLSAKRLKRNFIGIEIDKDYYDIINHRLNQPFEAKLF